MKIIDSYTLRCGACGSDRRMVNAELEGEDGAPIGARASFITRWCRCEVAKLHGPALTGRLPKVDPEPSEGGSV